VDLYGCHVPLFSMWTYEQSTGDMLDPNGNLLAVGYSGAGAAKNNPAYQNVVDAGPIPQGEYMIGLPIDSPTHGPHAMPLTPSADNQMFGRDEFLIHGDSITNPGNASEGCIILPLFARERISESGDYELRVTV
jgi:Protein of unknown function (DUF2778)